MIGIYNRGKLDESSDLWRYEVYINKELICSFKHNRAEGLSTCLHEAGDAVERHMKRELEELCLKIKKELDA